jgi:hypothetical protein
MTIRHENGFSRQSEQLIPRYQPYRQAESEAWDAEQRARAPAILEALRTHLPAQVLSEAEDFFSNLYGCECFYDLFRRGRAKADLLADQPDANEEEVQNFLDSGIWRSSDEVAKQRARYRIR